MSPGPERENVGSHRVMVWAIVASIALLGLGIVLFVQHHRAQRRWATFLSESPGEGSRVFQAKGCSHCHAVNGVGAAVALDLGKKHSAQPGLPQLVTAMWNHAPQMWQRMSEKRVTKSPLDDQEMAAIFAYIYMAQHEEGPGDPQRGRQLLESQRCLPCHARGGEKPRWDLAAPSEFQSPLGWIEALWNNASKMQVQMQERKLSWPQFQGHDLSDLYSYVYPAERGSPPPVADPPPDPERGWKLFQEKRCIACHSIKNDDGRAGPTLGPIRNLPPTFTQLGELMVNKAPKMLRAMDEQGIERPQLQGQDMTDLFAFLYSLCYVEPTGSAHVGRSLFSWRGCYRCHGVDAEGASNGPALRGRGRQYTSIALAAALWRHGPNMNRRSERMNVGWPTLLETDVGDLLTFLNSPVEQAKLLK